MPQLSDYEIPVNGGEQSVATSLFIEDPEGNGLKFYVDQDFEECFSIIWYTLPFFI
jgi:catechol 2,3-dioxygenase